MTSIIPIPNYPQTTSLNGSEVVVGVQAGTTSKIPVSQIATFARTFSPGNQTFGVKTITSAYAVLLTDQVILATNAAGVPTFPTAVGIQGQAYIFKNASGSSITPATTSGQTIDGSAPSSLANHGVLRIFSDNANWQTW
jgi:hypothetical protein